MKFKFYEALLHIAVALSFVDWNYRYEPERNDAGPFLPRSILQGQVEDQNSILPTSVQPIIKEEDNIINSIIIWEESQRRNRFRQNTDLIAYPIASQNSPFQSYETETGLPSSSQISSQESTGSPTAPGHTRTVSSSWPSSPGSSYDDGELFGAVGYTPLSSSQYFDIESFLSGNLSSASSSLEDIYLPTTREGPASPNWLGQSSVPSETVEELAQFLQASIESPEEEELNKKKSFSSAVLNYPEYLHESLDDIYNENKQGIVVPSSLSMISDCKNGIKDIDKILVEELYDPNLGAAAKGSQLTGIQSYGNDKDKEKSMFIEKDIKRKIITPFRKKSTWLDQSEAEPFDYSSVTDCGKNLLDELFEPNEENDTKGCNKIWSDLPYTRNDIIKMEIEQFNGLMSNLDPLQQHILKDIRRRGKNKLAARNCRKRKVEAINKLEVVLDETDKQRKELLEERAMLEKETAEIRKKSAYLYEHIFKNLRDNRGLPYSSDEYALTYTSDGSVYLVPKSQEKESISVR